MLQHAKLSASGAQRWASCAGSVKAESGLPDTTNPHSIQGSAAHELAELCFETKTLAYDWIDKPLIEYDEITVDREMADNIHRYMEYILETPGERFIETRLDFSDWVPDGFGTSDCVVINGDTLHVIDLKYGKGKVLAKDNLQGALYALGAYAEFNYIASFKTIKITIIQPRIDHFDSWEIETEELLKIGDWLAVRALETQKENPTLTPSTKACQWCKARDTCPARIEIREKKILKLLDDL